ncbi:MAG TPA: radical SAM protein [Chitinophagales bacterium]|nr:radical SAM protein [Chitinophagales bacterium]
MKVCLIRPSQLVTRSSIGNKAAVPLGIAFLGAALEKAGHEVTLIDAIAENPERLEAFMEEVYLNGLNNEETIHRIPADAQVIGFSLMFSMNWLNDRELIKLTRKKFPDAFIIAGGEHITALPEFSIKQTNGCIDACVLGEGELTIIDLLDAVIANKPLNEVPGILLNHNGEILRTPPRKRKIEIDELPWPAWHLLPVKEYFEHGMVFGVDRGNCLPLMASRGCPYQCTFCSSHDMWGTRYVLRSVADVANEIEWLHKKFHVQNIDFYDLTAIVKRDWIVELCREIISRKLPITWQLPSGTRSEAIDKEVAELMYQSGCRNVTYAPESGSDKLLKIIKKKVKLSSLLQSARDSVKSGLNVKVNIIVGLPDETHADIWRTLLFLVKCSWIGVHDTTPGLFYPYPGSVLFNKLFESGDISLKDDTYFHRLIFTDSLTRNYAYNKNMSIHWVRFYEVMVLLIFYGTNYLFRPMRFLKTVKNIFTRKYESRLEMTFADWLKENKLAPNSKAMMQGQGA